MIYQSNKTYWANRKNYSWIIYGKMRIFMRILRKAQKKFCTLQEKLQDVQKIFQWLLCRFSQRILSLLSAYLPLEDNTVRFYWIQRYLFSLKRQDLYFFQQIQSDFRNWKNLGLKMNRSFSRVIPNPSFNFPETLQLICFIWEASSRKQNISKFFQRYQD